jgi:cold-inducible RNA-binding protein
MGNRIYVGNLSFHSTEDALRTAFAEVGEVTEVKVITDRETGQSRGFAFVTMASSADATTAIERLNGSLLEGRPLRVNEAQERAEGSRGGGGGFGRSAGGGGRSYGGERRGR